MVHERRHRLLFGRRPRGNYTVTFTDALTPRRATGHPPARQFRIDVILVPKAPVLVSTALTGDPAPDAVVQAVGTIGDPRRARLVSVAWTQEPAVWRVQIANGRSETARTSRFLVTPSTRTS